MSFKLPDSQPNTASLLRDLEQNCAQSTSKDIRGAMVRAAQELEDWKTLAETVASELDEAVSSRISQMASSSRVEEIQRETKQRLASLAQRLREQL